MADDNMDPFGEHDKTDSHPDETCENIPSTPGGVIGGSTWKPEHEQETSFGGTSQKTEVLKEHIKVLHRMLFEETGQTTDTFHFDDFELRDGKLYYIDKKASLMIKGGTLRSFGLLNLGFDIPVDGKVTARQAIMLNKAEEEMPSRSDVDKVDNIELQEITENMVRSTENLTVQFEGESSEDLPM